MKRTIAIMGLSLCLALPVFGQRRGFRQSSAEPLPLAKTESERRVLAVLDEAAKSGGLFLSVPVSDGRMLRLLAEAAGARNIVEIGTSTGYSGLWLCLALQATGGKLTTFEVDPDRAAMAREHFRRAGLDHLVTVVEGDAHTNVTKLKEPIDILFIDADKEGYVDYLEKLLPRVRPGGLVLAHNIDQADDYVSAVRDNPDIETLFYRDGGGLGITLKKR